MRVLFIGGCQVIGFPFEAAAGFPHIVGTRLFSELGVLVDVRTVPYIKYSHVSRVAEAIEAYSPEVIVLQLGHFEASRGLRDVLKRFLRRFAVPGNTGNPSSATRSGYPAEHGGIQATLLWRLRDKLRFIVQCLLGFPGLDLDDCRADFFRLLSRIVAPERYSVVCLSCFPCVDSVSSRNRRALSKMMKEQVRAFEGPRFVYLDNFEERISASALFDPIHLSRDGQAIIAEIVVEGIKRAYAGSKG